MALNSPKEGTMPGDRRPLRRGVALTKQEAAEYGPVQIIVIGFENPDLQGEILAELERLRKLEVVRLVDLVVVANSDNGELAQVQTSDLTVDQAAELGAIAGALVGFGAAGEEGAEAGATLGADAAAEGGLLGGAVWSVAHVVPPGSMAAVVLLEHRWAIPLRDAVRRAGGVALVDAWIHPEDLVLYGVATNLI
jgi:uncharacterized membrane protein